MIEITKTISKHCPKCDKDVEFEIELDYVKYNYTNGISICLRCPCCDTVVTAEGFSTFIRTGKIG